MNKKQMVRLTESDLQNIIKESVMQILKENSENEVRMGSYLSSIFGQGRKKGEEVGRNVKDAAQRGWNSATDAVQRGWNSAKDAAQRGYDATAQKVGQGVNAVRGAYDNVAQGVKTMHQNAMQDSSMDAMKSSMDKFEKDLQVFLKNGGQVDRQLKSRLSGIMNMLNNYQPHA